jgi:hypothetical protein
MVNLEDYLLQCLSASRFDLYFRVGYTDKIKLTIADGVDRQTHDDGAWGLIRLWTYIYFEEWRLLRCYAVWLL